ncbi:sensor histidine kinase [Clostridium neuense]|uniref:sensor histidine kinase n=1 Tax=Clostridium neuense TaxID=1728934 RepID=UPI0038780801
MRRFILVIILSVVTGMLSYSFYQNKEFENLRNKNEIVEDKLKDMVKEYKEYFNERIKCLGVEDESKREDSFFKTQYEFYKKHDNKNNKMLFRFVTINNTSGEMFWEDWPYKDILKYEPKEVNINKSNVENYISENSYTYIKYGQNYANGYISMLPKNPGEEKTDITNWTTYYWLDKRDYSSDDILKIIDININNARKMAALICALGIVTLIYLISLLVYIKKFGIIELISDIKARIIRIGINCMRMPFWNPCKILLKIIKKVFIGGVLRRSVMLLILLIAVGIVDYHFYASDNYKNWFNRKWALHDKLTDLSKGYEKELGEYTNHFFKINDGEIKEEDFEKHDFKSYYGRGDSDAVRFVVVDNKKHKVFWEYWTLADLKVNKEIKADIDKNIIAYIKKNAYVYNNSRVMVGGGVEIPSPKYAALTGAKPSVGDVYMDMTVYYWFDKRDVLVDGLVYDINLKINIARKNIELLVALIVAAGLYLISLLLYIRKFGIKKFLSDIKSECIELKLKFDFVCEKLSFEGPYKKAIIIFSVTLVFYLTISYVVDGGEDPSYFIKKIILLEEPIDFTFILFIFIVFLLSLKKIKNFKYTLEYTEKIAKGDLSLEIKKSGDIDMDKLAIKINSIRDGYEKAFKEAIKNERVKTELITNVSHDLKTPLTSILTYVDLLKRDNLSLEEKEDYMKIVEKKTKKLNNLVEDLVEVSEVNSGKINLNREKIDMVFLIYQVIGECSNYHDERNIKFKVKSFSEKVELYIDGKRMSRLIGNVISNAIKYSMPNTNVYVEVKKENDDIVVSFKSISEDEMKFDTNEIFDRFKRGDESRNSKVEGSGLGLAIAKGIAELHGGRMYAEKEGDLFKMFLILKITP